MDLTLIFTIIGATAAVIGCIYGFRQDLKNSLRIFKTDIKDDINSHIDRLETRMDKLETNMYKFESKINSLEERMFWMATGKKLEDAILEERMKNLKTDP